MTTSKQFFNRPRLWGLLCGLTLAVAQLFIPTGVAIYRRHLLPGLILLWVLALTLGLIQPVRAQSVTTGTVVAWGDNQHGQVTVPAGLSGVTAIAAGGYHSLALKSNGTVVVWGDNGSGQLNVPAGLSGVTAIAGGDFHSLALKSDGTVVAWGSNSNGQSTVPGGLSGVIAIAAGGYHSLALKNDGTVVAWGCTGIASYNRGQCNVPTGLNNVTAIAAGGYHSLALKNDGTVVAWGENGSGQSTVPAGLSGIVAIAAGEFHSLAFKNDGTVVGWGCGTNYGQCTIPTGLSGVTAIAVGHLHSLARKNDGTVVGWGWNGFGQLNIPAGLSSVTAIAGGYLHTLALEATDDGTPPTANPTQSPAANASGWTTSRNITVNWNWTDAGSGIEPTQCDLSSNSGNALGTLTLTAFCIDRLGNLGSASYTLKIDPFAPNIVGTNSPAPNGFWWNNSAVTVSFTCADGGLSGVATNTLAGATLSSEGANQAVTNIGSCVDNAGNVSTPITVGPINIDLTKPTISAAATTQPNGNGWYNSDVTVRFTCADALSGTAPCPGDQILSSEGTAVNSTPRTVLDRASNVSDPSNIVTVKIDKTAPIVTVTGVSDGASYTLGSVPTAACSTTDALSGVATPATVNISGGNGAGSGSFTATCSGAIDVAGNSAAPVSVSYTVGAPPPTATSTNTPVPPTATPTNTPVPPTATPMNTPVPPTATPTNTPVPPTATATATATPSTGTLVGVCGPYTVYQTGSSYTAAGWGGAIKVGTNGNNTLNSGSGADLMLGLGGNDKLDGKGGDDVLCGDDGVDLLLGGAGNDYLDGGNQVDLLNGGTGDYDQLVGGNGNDTLLDGDGVISAAGRAGNDLLTIALRNGWRNVTGQPRFAGLTAGYGNDTVALAILDPVQFFVDITGDERDNPASPLEGNADRLALVGVIDPASKIIKFEQQVVTASTDGFPVDPTTLTDESGAEFLTEPVGDNTDGLQNQHIFLPLVNR